MSSKKLARRFRPRCEVLERRAFLAGDPLFFIEDFSDDNDHDLPGFDEFDNDSTTGPDRLLIQHTISALDHEFQPVFIVVGSPFQPSAPYCLVLLGPATDTISLPPTGSSGGLAAGEEIGAVAIGYSGLGTIRFFGEGGMKTVPFNTPPSIWESVTVTANSLTDSDAEIRAITRIEVSTIEAVRIDDITFLIGGVIPNNPPVANPDHALTATGQPADIDILANDGDADGDEVTITSVADVLHGVAQITNESVRFTPEPGFEGDAGFVYTIDDGRGGSASTSVQIQVITPRAVDDRDATLPGVPVDIDVLDNDRVPGLNDTLVVVSASDPDHGSIEVHEFENGIITYTPDPGFHGRDTFSYVMGDQFGNSSSASVSVTVNRHPIALDTTFKLPHGQIGPFVLPAPGLLAGPTDPDGDVLELVPAVKAVEGGTVTLNADGSFTIESTRADGLIVPATFSYAVTDEFGSFGTALVRIDVINTAPVAFDHTIAARHGIVTPFRFEVPYFEADADDVTFELLEIPSYGAVVPQATRIDPVTGQRWLALQFGTALGDLRGPVHFTYRLNDDYSSGNVASVTLDVDNLAPIAREDRYVLFDHHDVPGYPDFFDSARSILANDSDGNLDPIEAVLVAGPDHGSLDFLLPNGVFRYRPPIGFEGRDRFVYHITDGVSSSALAEVVIAFGLESCGEPNRDRYFTPRDEPLLVSVPGILENDFRDPDGDTQRAVLSEGPMHGDLVFSENGDGAFIYIPDPAYVGVDSFLYNVTDDFYFIWSGANPVNSANFGSVQIVVFGPGDHDADGISDSVEALAPNGGDIDNNGEPDADQPNVASYRNPVDGRYIGLEVLPASWLDSHLERPVLSDVHATADLPADAPPFPYPFAFGLLHFRILTAYPGQEVLVRLAVPDEIHLSVFYWKFGPVPNYPYPHWYEPDDSHSEAVTYGSGETSNGIIFRITEGGRGDNDLTANGVIVDPGGIAVRIELPLRVERVEINDGAPQRSMIESISITFSQIVVIDPGAFVLSRPRRGRRPPHINVSIAAERERTVARLTFSGSHVIAGSLPNSDYTLIIRSDRVHGLAGGALDGDGDGFPGGDYVMRFRRRFGDADGDGDVDGGEMRRFRSSIHAREGTARYVRCFDFNGDGHVGWPDLRRIRSSFRRHPKAVHR